MTGRRGAQRGGSEGRLLIYLSLFFVATRLLFLALGARFDASPLGGYWQYLDPVLLREDLARSLFYLHSQPPLFNLGLGLVLKSQVPPAVAFQLLLAAAGLICYLSSFVLMRRLGASHGLAFALATALVCRPDFVLLESWLMYDVPVTALLGLAAVAFAAFAGDRPRPAAGHALFPVLAMLCATRGFFHLLYFVAAAALCLLALPDRRRQVVTAAAVPGLLLVALYAKNLAVFGHPGPSSWLGMNLSRIVTSALSAEELASLRVAGELSPVATIPAFSPPQRYPAEYFEPLRHPEVPALSERFKSTGSVNYNHQGYLDVSRDSLRDSLWIIGRRPDAYLHGMAKAGYNFTRPLSELEHLRRNRQALAGFVETCQPWLYGRLDGLVRYGGEPRAVYLVPTLGIPLLIVYALAAAGRSRLASGRGRLLAFLALTILYTALVGNALEVWENQRFRFYVDPFLAALLASALARFSPARGHGAEQATPRRR